MEKEQDLEIQSDLTCWISKWNLLLWKFYVMGNAIGMTAHRNENFV